MEHENRQDRPKRAVTSFIAGALLSGLNLLFLLFLWLKVMDVQQQAVGHERMWQQAREHLHRYEHTLRQMEQSYLTSSRTFQKATETRDAQIEQLRTYVHDLVQRYDSPWTLVEMKTLLWQASGYQQTYGMHPLTQAYLSSVMELAQAQRSEFSKPLIEALQSYEHDVRGSLQVPAHRVLKEIALLEQGLLEWQAPGPEKPTEAEVCRDGWWDRWVAFLQALKSLVQIRYHTQQGPAVPLQEQVWLIDSLRLECMSLRLGYLWHDQDVYAEALTRMKHLVDLLQKHHALDPAWVERYHRVRALDVFPQAVSITPLIQMIDQQLQSAAEVS